MVNKDTQTLENIKSTWEDIKRGAACSEDYIFWLVYSWPELAPAEYQKKFRRLIPNAAVQIIDTKRPKNRGYIFEWEVICCPYCRRKHHHGAGLDPDRVNDFLGYRVAHCSEADGRSYKLVLPDNLIP